MSVKIVRTVIVAMLAAIVVAPHARAWQHDTHNRHDPRALREDPRLAPGQLAPVLEGLGDTHFPITTSVPRAQQFFDQGLRLTYGFNHQEDMHGNDWGLYQTFLSMPLYTMTRFGMWEAILDEPRPSEDTPYFLGIWHYARGMARVHTGSTKQARKELRALREIVADPAAADAIGFANAAKLLTIAENVLAGELAAAKGRWDEAVGHLDRVRLEDSLIYNEPPDWYYPVRHSLGAVLLEAGRPVEAEVVYWDDLGHNPDNGFALYGLWQSLVAQDRDGDAAEALERFEDAWSSADTTLTSSRF